MAAGVVLEHNLQSALWNQFNLRFEIGVNLANNHSYNRVAKDSLMQRICMKGV